MSNDGELEVFAMPEPGTTLDGKYYLERVLGAGGAGVVFEAADVASKERVAIKILSVEALLTEDMYDRFTREAQIASQLKSPHIAKLITTGTTASGMPYIVHELLEGSDLAQMPLGRSMAVETGVDYVMQALEGMDEAHSLGIVHRDLKPANIFVCRAVAGSRPAIVKVLDFGYSKAPDGRSITLASDAFGTPAYVSPEQLRATRDVDARADLWSLGVVLYECVTGRLPFRGSSAATIVSVLSDAIPPPRAIRGDVPVGLESVMVKALEKEPADRFQSAREFIDALAEFGLRQR